MFELYNTVIAGPGVTIKPAPGAHPVFTGLAVDGSQGLTFQGLDIQMTPTQQYGVQAYSTSRIVLDGVIIHQADGSLNGVGVLARNSSDITVSNSEFHHLGVGFSAIDTVRPAVVGNRFHDIETDGMDFAGDPGASAIGNRLSDFTPGPGDHPDAIQFWATAANPLPSGGVARDNVIRRGKGQVMQGVFVEDQANITITGNGMSGTMYNGISLARVKTALIADNFVQGWADMGTRIITRGKSSDVTIRNNSSQSVVTVDSEGPFPKYVESGTTKLQPAAAGDTSALDRWLAARGGR
jgi:hypothetical protein